MARSTSSRSSLATTAGCTLSTVPTRRAKARPSACSAGCYLESKSGPTTTSATRTSCCGLGPVLAGGQKQWLECVRRKGRKDTLRDGDDDKPLDPAAAKTPGGRDGGAVCHHVRHLPRHAGCRRPRDFAGQRRYRQFAVRRRRRPFAAASGAAVLESEADALFTPKASTKAINKKLSELDHVAQGDQESTAYAARVERARRGVSPGPRAARRSRAAVERLAREKSRLERFRDALPAVTQRAETISKLQPLADARLLRPTFTAERVAARKVARFGGEVGRRGAGGVAKSGPAVGGAFTLGDVAQPVRGDRRVVSPVDGVRLGLARPAQNCRPANAARIASGRGACGVWAAT